MEIKNLEYRAMADGRRKISAATIIDDDGTERKANRNDIQDIEKIRHAMRVFMNDIGVTAAELVASPRLMSALEGSCVAFNVKERLLNDLINSHLHSLTTR